MVRYDVPEFETRFEGTAETRIHGTGLCGEISRHDDQDGVDAMRRTGRCGCDDISGCWVGVGKIRGVRMIRGVSRDEKR